MRDILTTTSITRQIVKILTKKKKFKKNLILFKYKIISQWFINQIIDISLQTYF